MDNGRIKWNSRKIVFGLLLLLVGVAVEMVGPRGLTETTSMFLIAIGAAYFAGNVGDKMAARGQAQAASNESSSEVAEGVEALNQKLDAIAEASQGERETYLKILKGVLDKQDGAAKKIDYIITKAGLK